ncbi:MAG: hypothetical protein GOV00_00410 [Candidatus Altiarchaeota archaeon]|nr:hypothetical protein [Candidatus Altiarchaeota archaeon]
MNMVLDELMEKKDLRIYLNLRIEKLEREIRNIPNTISLPKIGVVFERTSGRIRELKILLHRLENGEIKLACKKMWKAQDKVNGNEK